jgi:hypothetical protein
MKKTILALAAIRSTLTAFGTTVTVMGAAPAPVGGIA